MDKPTKALCLYSRHSVLKEFVTRNEVHDIDTSNRDTDSDFEVQSM